MLAEDVGQGPLGRAESSGGRAEGPRAQEWACVRPSDPKVVGCLLGDGVSRKLWKGDLAKPGSVGDLQKGCSQNGVGEVLPRLDQDSCEGQPQGGGAAAGLLGLAASVRSPLGSQEQEEVVVASLAPRTLVIPAPAQTAWALWHLAEPANLVTLRQVPSPSQAQRPLQPHSMPFQALPSC